MPLTRDFKETIQEAAQEDPEFRRALLYEAIESLLAGDIDSGKSTLRTYINATIGFSALAEITGKNEKSLMRMFGPKGNPRAQNIFEVISCLAEAEGLELSLERMRA